MKRHYGEALYAIPVDLSFGCPNRTKDGMGGCTFCPEHGARAAQIADAKSVEEQVSRAISFASRRYGAKSFALYIQAYTATFATLEKQKNAYERLLELHQFKALHIGTRPDCLSERTLEYLVELNKKIEIVVELGVQTLHDATLLDINRGHDVSCSLQAIRRLKEKGLKVYAHLIIGLFGETDKMWLESLRGVVEAGIDGVKFHNLHIVEKTAMAHKYANEPFVLMDEYAYAEALIELLRHTPSYLPILRLATDTPKAELVAPKWHMQKGQFAKYIEDTMRYRGVRQGDKIESANFTPIIHAKTKSVILDDGSVTLWNEEFREYYHPKAGAFRVARELFIANSHLEERLKKGDVRVLEIGFGMGYNALECLKLAERVNVGKLDFIGVERDIIALHKAISILEDAEHLKLLEALVAEGKYSDDIAKITLMAHEARYAIRLLEDRFDVIFLDPFLESNNASLVSVEFIKRLRDLLNEDGVLVASTSLQATQIAMRLAGFETRVFSDNSSDIKGIIANLTSCKVVELGIPYSDPHGVLSDKQIEAERQKIGKTFLKGDGYEV